jgi:hypothetical protein
VAVRSNMSNLIDLASQYLKAAVVETMAYVAKGKAQARACGERRML